MDDHCKRVWPNQLISDGGVSVYKQKNNKKLELADMSHERTSFAFYLSYKNHVFAG